MANSSMGRYNVHEVIDMYVQLCICNIMGTFPFSMKAVKTVAKRCKHAFQVNIQRDG